MIPFCSRKSANYKKYALPYSREKGVERFGGGSTPEPVSAFMVLTAKGRKREMK